MTTSPDPRQLFGRALDQTGRIVQGVAPDDLGASTPCSEYDVRTLLGHLISVLRRVTHVAGGGEALDVPQVTGTVDDGDWAAAWDRDRALLDTAWADDAILDTILSLPFGKLPGRAALAAYTLEMTTHGWDLAVATRQAERLDDGLAGIALDIAQKFIPAEPRGGRVPFGPPTAVPADATPYDQLAAWMGRSVSASA